MSEGVCRLGGSPERMARERYLEWEERRKAKGLPVSEGDDRPEWVGEVDLFSEADAFVMTGGVLEVEESGVHREIARRAREILRRRGQAASPLSQPLTWW